MHEIDPLISEYSHESFRPRAPEALQTLRKVASLVKPIMRQRGWRVGTLSEFWPPEKNLLGLNWNRGSKICLRLRYPYDERQFIPLEEVVDTMLHELCHIIHGAHDEPFHTLWNQLREEHEALARKGYTGEGFLSEGRTLGGSGRIPKHEAARRARLAAEKRRVLNAGSGQKLGGAPVRRGEDIRKVIADAAQKRATITKGCASGTDERSRDIAEAAEKSGTRTKAVDLTDEDEEAVMLAYIDLIQEEEREKYGAAYIPPSSQNPAGSRSRTAPPIPSDTKPSPSLAPAPASQLIDLTTTTNPAQPKPESDDTWTCPICTLINPAAYLCCHACSTERPSLPSPSPLIPPSHPPPQTNNSNPNPQKKKSALENLKIIERQAAAHPPRPMGWLCHRCGNWMETQWWTCAACGGIKLSS